ncbi:sugar lactone lactonase YvrE [Saccharomonospora amisosensis]|uniref:Sugar lactone lactonase YvrE n=2 Tax=Saccharomonospora amisosensis TaxID=1128677 RepID=A0A7X5ZQ83_9PSEU|nr:sugar lactone lactonase YvrE [Saccharomonospora amisosensis]
MSVRGLMLLLGATVLGLVASGSTVARADEPVTVCAIDDPRLAELSGLVAHEGRWYAVNDGGTRIEVFVLDRECEVRDVIVSPTDPYDIEDLAVAPDGTLWLGDTGDNRKQRRTVALHAVSPQGGSVLYRLTYPDGPHDAEALLLDRAGTPYIVTKSSMGQSAVYTPRGELTSPGPTPLVQVGTLNFSTTDTPGGPVGTIGTMAVTGAASTADGSVLALRTYTDAYLYPAPDGDVVAALRRPPIRIPLPGEQQGEAIAFADDGTLLSASEGIGSPVRAVAGATARVGDVSASVTPNPPPENGEDGAGATTRFEAEAGADGASVGSEQDGEREQDGKGMQTLPGILLAMTIAGLAMLGISRARR